MSSVPLRPTARRTLITSPDASGSAVGAHGMARFSYKRGQEEQIFSPTTEVDLGSAPAADAVFRALAENFGRTRKLRTRREVSCPKRLDAGRVQQRPGRACSPTSVFGSNACVHFDCFFDYWLNRKNCWVPEIRLVTAFWPSMTTGPGETAVQTAGETRFVVDCKVNPTALVGHVKIIFCPEGTTVSCGALTDPNERLNIVPLPELPPWLAVPYRVLPDKINPAAKLAPSPPVKVCRIKKPVPSVLTLNTVPLPELPPPAAVP